MTIYSLDLKRNDARVLWSETSAPGFPIYYVAWLEVVRREIKRRTQRMTYVHINAEREISLEYDNGQWRAAEWEVFDLKGSARVLPIEEVTALDLTAWYSTPHAAVQALRRVGRGELDTGTLCRSLFSAWKATELAVQVEVVRMHGSTPEAALVKLAGRMVARSDDAGAAAAAAIYRYLDVNSEDPR